MKSPPYSWDTLLSQLALNCFRSGIPEEAVVSRARFRHFVRKTVGTGASGGAECTAGVRISEANALLSREQQLLILIAEFMKRRYEFPL